jgi:uncharacterized protein with NRDE domain
MCLILFAWRAHPRWPLVVAANRDEFHHRPAAPADWWEGGRVWGGRDLEAGGTWLGIGRHGRWAAVTNVRDAAALRGEKAARSRGALTADFLTGDMSPQTWAEGIDGAGYGGFNLLIGDAHSVWWAGNRSGPPVEVGPGVHGLSNAALDTPWPKVRAGVQGLSGLLDAPGIDALFDVLGDRRRAPDSALPDTGVGLDLERQLSPLFLVDPVYGTRASTALIVSAGGEVRGEERTFGADGLERSRVGVGFQLQ